MTRSEIEGRGYGFDDQEIKAAVELGAKAVENQTKLADAATTAADAFNRFVTTLETLATILIEKEKSE